MQAPKKTETEFEVALLIENIQEAQALSEALRSIGIYAHYYSDLDEFWVAANAQSPDFLIIDVKRMSQGATLFKNHPKVADGSLAFSFYYSDATKVLVNSTFSFNHYGCIKKEINLLGQLRAVLRRRNEELRLIEEKRALEERISRLQKRSDKILRDSQTTHRYQRQFQELMELVSRLGEAKSRHDYLNRLSSVLGDWQACESFGIYSLNSSDQKLVSFRAIRPKLETLPDLWLARPGERGIDQYASEMACEVAIDLLGSSARAIHVKGIRPNAEILVVGKFDEQFLSAFPWELLEERLSHFYGKLLLSEGAREESLSHSLSVWEAFSYMDDMNLHQAPGMHKVAMVDFGELLSRIHERPSNRFFWKAFFEDFEAELVNALSGNFKLSAYGAQGFLVFIDNNHLESDFRSVKAVAENFSYWRYFQDTTGLTSKRMKAETKILAPASLNYLRRVSKGLSEAGESLNAQSGPSDAFMATPQIRRRPTLDA